MNCATTSMFYCGFTEKLALQHCQMPGFRRKSDKQRGGGEQQTNPKNKTANIYIENVSGNIALYTQWHKSHVRIYYSERALTTVPNTRRSWASLCPRKNFNKLIS